MDRATCEVIPSGDVTNPWRPWRALVHGRGSAPWPYPWPWAHRCSWFSSSPLAFSNSIGAAQAADNARSLHWANATLGTSSLTRAALVQAMTFAGLEEEGLVSDGDLAYALEQLEGSHAELAQLERGGVGRPSLPP